MMNDPDWKKTNSSLPTGIVSFLFTDIEGSAKLAQDYPGAMPALLEKHNAILGSTIRKHNGVIFQIIGDAICAAFHTTIDALNAALVVQEELYKTEWTPAPIRVRMGIHTGIAQVKATGNVLKGYDGYLTLTRTQRIMSAAHGGQVLLSNPVSELLNSLLPEGVTLRDLGEHRLKGLENPERIWQVVKSDLPQDFPPIKSIKFIQSNLPVRMTSFLGREREITDVKAMLTATRLLTLTGVGGTGKTRLALEVADELLDSYENGIWFVELAPLVDPELIPTTVSMTFGILEQTSRPAIETLLEFLHQKHLLLILDNCEHLIDASAQFADRVLRTCPDISILATSREALGIAGERLFSVPSLELPILVKDAPIDTIASTESVRLFIERAIAVQPRFALTDENAEKVAQICQQLDGIPLAIELAAARLKSMSVETVAAHLDDRFRLLTGGSRSVLPRQQTLRAAIDWSYNLLSEPERHLLQRLSQFVSGFSLEAAEAICGDGSDSFEVFEMLGSLVDKSLLMLDESYTGARYILLETIRYYGREKLAESGDSENARSKHLNYFLDLAETAEPEIWKQEQKLWLDRLERDYDNIRSALEWSSESVKEDDVQAGIRLAVALQQFWFVRSHTIEGDRYITNLISRSEARENLRIFAYGSWLAADLKQRNGANSSVAQSLLEESLTIGEKLGDRLLIAHTLGSLGNLYYLMGDTSRKYFERSLALYRDLGDKPGQAIILSRLGRLAGQLGDDTSYRAFYQENLKICQELGHQLGIAGTLIAMGDSYAAEGEVSEARAAYNESLSIYRNADDKSGIIQALLALAEVALSIRDTSHAQTYLSEAISIARETNNKLYLGWGLIDRGDAECEEGKFTRAHASYEEALHVFKEANLPVGVVFALVSSGIVAIHEDDLPNARELFKEALTASIDFKEKTRMTFFTLFGIALLANKEGNLEQAVNLLAIVGPHIMGLGSIYAADYKTIVSAIRTKLGEETFSSAWAKGLEMQKSAPEEIIEFAKID